MTVSNSVVLNHGTNKQGIYNIIGDWIARSLKNTPRSWDESNYILFFFSLAKNCISLEAFFSLYYNDINKWNRDWKKEFIFIPSLNRFKTFP